MLRIAMPVREDDVEDALDVLLPMLPAGIQDVPLPNGLVEIAALGVPGHMPSREELEEAVRQWLAGPVTEEEVPFDWRERRARFGKGYLIGDRISVRSPLDPPAPAGVIDIVIERGESAFGTGAHPTTRTCIEFLLTLPPRGPFADLGSGTGAIAIAAAKLGFAPVFAVDHTQDAVASSALNAHRNGVAVATFQLDLTRDEAPPAETVAANVPSVVHRKLAAGLAPEVRHLILSGIVMEESDLLIGLYEQRGMRRVDSRDAEGWATVLLERDG